MPKLLSIDKIELSTLKTGEHYRRWKEEIHMVCKALGVSYLLKPHIPPSLSFTTSSTPPAQTGTDQSQSSSSSSSTAPTNISLAKGKGKADSDDEEEEISRVRWEKQSEQFVSKLYFFVAPTYKPIISKLDPVSLPKLFSVFDKLFQNSDTMSLISKRGELDKFEIKLDKTLLDQVVKFEEQLTLFEDLGGTISGSEKAYLLIRALPTSYKEKLSNILGGGNHSFEEIKEALSIIFKRDTAWDLLPTATKSNDHSDTALYSHSNSNPKSSKKNKGVKGKGEKGKGKEEKPGHTIQCFNCNKAGHKTMECPQSVTLEAREKLKKFYNEMKERKGNNQKGGGKNSKPEKEAACLATPMSHHSFVTLYPPPLNSSQSTLSALALPTPQSLTNFHSLFFLLFYFHGGSV